jgi:hypothetical protein
MNSSLFDTDREALDAFETDQRRVWKPSWTATTP